MLGYYISLLEPVNYEYTGKFQAPSAQWIHQKMKLDNFELIVMTEGNLYLSYANTNYSVKEGEFLLLPPRTPVCYREGFQKSYCSFYWLHFTTVDDLRIVDLSDSMNMIKYENTIVLPNIGKLLCPDKILVLMKQLQDFIRSGYDSLANNYMTSTILCELYNQTLTGKNENPKSTYSNKQIYYDMVDYINKNLYRDLKISDIADNFGYNGKYLSHVFGNITGTSLKQFILQMKMNEANYMLLDTNKTVREISACLGFSDNHNFMRTYKKITGLTPTEYRNAYAKRMLFHV